MFPVGEIVNGFGGGGDVELLRWDSKKIRTDSQESTYQLNASLTRRAALCTMESRTVS